MSASGNGKADQNGTGAASVIDKDTTFKGTLVAKSTVVVMGVLEGELTGPGLDVTESGLVLGKAKTQELRARGEIAGEFEAEHMELGGKVRDHTVLRARSLMASAGREDGQTVHAVFGECSIEVGEVPSKEQAVKAFLAANRTPGVTLAPVAQATPRTPVEVPPSEKPNGAPTAPS